MTPRLAKTAAAVAAAAAAALAAAGGSAAATASVRGDNVSYTAAPGEANRVVMTVGEDLVEIRDSGAMIEAGPGCVALGAAAVRCATIAPSDGVFDIGLAAGDGDDVVKALKAASGGRAALSWDGGEGHDHLVVCVLPDDWPNFLHGGLGNDRLEICPELPSAGTYPTMSWHMSGGPGDDTLIGGRDIGLMEGNQGRDVLVGKQRFDNLNGGSGADHLIGGAGSDLLRGGEGRDRLSARDGRRDRVFGGPQRDRARIDWRRDQVRAVEVFL